MKVERSINNTQKTEKPFRPILKTRKYALVMIDLVDKSLDQMPLYKGRRVIYVFFLKGF